MGGIGFELIKDMDAIKNFYGDIPQIAGAPRAAYEEFEITLEDEDLLMEDFVDQINDLCGTLLDYGDIDYFDASKCAKLKAWLESRLKRSCALHLRELYTVLLDYATRAIALGTGVVVTI